MPLSVLLSSKKCALRWWFRSRYRIYGFAPVRIMQMDGAVIIDPTDWRNPQGAMSASPIEHHPLPMKLVCHRTAQRTALPNPPSGARWRQCVSFPFSTSASTITSLKNPKHCSLSRANLAVDLTSASQRLDSSARRRFKCGVSATIVMSQPS